MITTRCLGLMLVTSIAACGGGGGGKTGGGGGGGSGGNGGSAAGSGGGSDAGPPPPACGSAPFQPPTGGKSYFVAPNGSDTAAGTMDAPFKTMKQGGRVAHGGDVVYLRDGVYNQSENVTATGAAGNPVVFMAQPGEHPILDGGTLGLAKSDSVLQLSRPQHVVVAGLEIRNSGGRGVQLIDGVDVVIRDCIIHDVAYKALGLNGDNLTAEGNVIYNAVMSNANSTASGGWAAAVTTQLLENGSPSTNVVVRGNSIHDAWGECVDALFVDGMSIIGNEVRDCFSVGLYVDTARAVRVEGNVVRAIDPAHKRQDVGHFMDGILLGAEAGDSSSPDFGADDVVIANNVVLGTHNGIGWWDDSDNARASNTYLNVQVVSNVIWGVEANAIAFDKVPSGRTAPSGAVLTDNILFAGGQGTVQLGDTSAWTITANLFPSSKPSTASDPSNLTGDPQLTGTPAVDAMPEVFRPSPSSPCRHAGRPVAAVPLDFACATRGTTDTTIGAFE